MTVRFGIVGLGLIANRFAAVLSSLAGVELTAVAARDQSRAESFARRFGASGAFQDYLDVIANPGVDIVYVGLTHNFHYDIVKACLQHRKAVLCEKPLVTTYRHAAELIDLAKQNQTLLMEALWTRCLPAFQQAHTWVQAGRIGPIKLITADFHHAVPFNPDSRLFNPRLAGGSLFDLGIYPISFATGILNEHPTKITGLAQLAPSGVDESASLALHFPSGALASLTCGFSVNAAGPARIYGAAGQIVVENCFGPQRCELYDAHGSLIESFAEPTPDGFIYQIRHCVGLFQQGQIESNLIPWKDSLASAAIFDALCSQWGIYSSP